MGTERAGAAVRPTKEQLAAAEGAVIGDVIGPQTAVLFCGINPGLYSGWAGRHFARPGNRFWPALHRSGFTPRRFGPEDQHLLPGLGLGITNVVARTTARADQLTSEEYRHGGALLAERVAAHRPGVLAVLGVTAYRSAFARPRAKVGFQDGDSVGGAPVWVLPNPSGLNAHWSADAIAAELRALRERFGGGPHGGVQGTVSSGNAGFTATIDSGGPRDGAPLRRTASRPADEGTDES